MKKKAKVVDLETAFLDEYKKAKQEAQEKINKHLNDSHEALDKAIQVSEQYAVPFSSSISPLGQSYRPSSMEKKWGEDNIAQLQEYNYENYDEDFELPEYEGWQHSAVC